MLEAQLATTDYDVESPAGREGGRGGRATWDERRFTGTF